MADVSQNVDGVEVETVFSTTSSSGSHRASGDLGHLITSNTNEAVSDDALVKALQDITCNLDENGLKKATELYSGNGNGNNMNPKVKDLQNGDGDTDSNLANLLDNHNGSSSSTDMVSELFKGIHTIAVPLFQIYQVQINNFYFLPKNYQIVNCNA